MPSETLAGTKGKIEEKRGLDGGEILTVRIDEQGRFHDQGDPNPNNFIDSEVGNRVRTISYRSLEEKPVTIQVKQFYPILSAKR